MYAVPPRGFSGPVKSRKGAEERKENAEEKKRERRRRGKQTGEGSPLSCAAGTWSSPVANSLLSTGSSPPFPFAATHTQTHTRARIHMYIYMIRRQHTKWSCAGSDRERERWEPPTQKRLPGMEGKYYKRKKGGKYTTRRRRRATGEKRRVRARE